MGDELIRSWLLTDIIQPLKYANFRFRNVLRQIFIVCGILVAICEALVVTKL